MLHLNRYPTESIILEYGNVLELFYCRCSLNKYEFHVYINHVIRERYTLTGEGDFIELKDDGIDFAFKIESNGKGTFCRKITIWCPKFVHIRRKELEKLERIA